MDRISVIIPVYNVAAYLPQCVESVLSQDHWEMEVILIDDGSTDASPEICDGYAARDCRVKVIHQKNGGAAAAKNAGLRIASGEYLSFVDSDDYLEPNVYGYMLSVLKQHSADAAQFAFREVYRSRSEDQVQRQGREVVSSLDYLTRFPKSWHCALLWNKLYKRSMFDGIFFEEGHKIDDEYFTYQGFLKPGMVVIDDRIIYNYRKRASSVMMSPEAGYQRILDCLDSTAKRREKILARYPRMKRLFDENYLDTLWCLSEDPANTRQSILLLKGHLKRYLRTWGNTFPPRYLWLMLLRVLVTPAETLCERSKGKQECMDPADYFL